MSGWDVDVWDSAVWDFSEGDTPVTGSSHAQRSRRNRQRIYALAHKVPVKLEVKDKPIPMSDLPLQELLNKNTELFDVAQKVIDRKLGAK